MADEIPSLTDRINEAVGLWCAENDSSLLTNFVFVAEFLEEDGGAPSNCVVTPPRTSTASSMGLALFAQNLFTELQRRDIAELVYEDLDDDD